MKGSEAKDDGLSPPQDALRASPSYTKLYRSNKNVINVRRRCVQDLEAQDQETWVGLVELRARRGSEG